MTGRRLALAFGLLPLLLPTPAHAQGSEGTFLSQFNVPDARSAGMGGAFTAVAEGPSAAWWNPGALPFGSTASVMPFSYTQPFPVLELLGDDHWQVSFGGAGHRGAVGAGIHYGHLRYKSGDPRVSLTWREQIFRVGAGVDLAQLVAGEGSAVRCGVGATAKLLRKSFQGMGDNGSGMLTEFDTAGNTIDMDLGGLLVYSIDLPGPAPADPKGGVSTLAFRTGVAARNVFDRKLEIDADAGPLGGGLAAGLAVECALVDLPRYGYLLRGQVSFEEEWRRKYDHPDEESGFLEYRSPIGRIGAEALFLDTFGVRVGHIDDARLDVHDWTWGVRVGTEMFTPPDRRRFGVAFDYADLPGYIVGGDERVSHYGVSGWFAP